MQRDSRGELDGLETFPFSHINTNGKLELNVAGPYLLTHSGENIIFLSLKNHRTKNLFL